MSGIKRALEDAIDHAFNAGRAFDGTSRMSDVMVVKNALAVSPFDFKDKDEPEWIVDMIVEAYADGIAHQERNG